VSIRNLTILSGINGTGKSSILQSILLIRQSCQQGLLPSQGLALNGDLAQIGAAQDALCEFSDTDQISFGIVADGREFNWSFLYKKDANVLPVVTEPPNESLNALCVLGDCFQYLSADRIGSRPFFEMSSDQVGNHRYLGSRGEYTAHFLEFFGNDPISIPGLAVEGATSLSLRDQVEAALCAIIPGIRIRLEKHSSMGLVNLRYAFTNHISGETNAYRSTNIGFGITYTLPIVVAILSAMPGALLLIENPEAHLHPRGQFMMGTMLAVAAANGVQLLVETHSDHVLNGVRVALYNRTIQESDVVIHFFDRGDDGTDPISRLRPTPIDQDGRISNWPAGFFDEFDKSLEALLLPRE
jgi:predicted ATPase